MKDQTPMEVRYPRRKGWARDLWRSNESHHVGYKTDRARPCCCGWIPVFEMYTEATERDCPAVDFVAICPRCERRAEGHGSLEYCLKQWNAENLSDDSMMVNMPIMEMSYTGAEKLSQKIFRAAKAEALELILKKHEEFGDRRDWKYQLKFAGDLVRLEIFFRESPLMMDLDGDGVISDIRKQVYPDLSPEERIRIPLKLTEM